MSEYMYYVVESSFVARVGAGTTERLQSDGTWVHYPDRWGVLTHGRLLEGREAALRKARQLLPDRDDNATDW